MAKCLFQAGFVVLAVGAVGVDQASLVRAQVFQAAPAPQKAATAPVAGVQQAGGPVTPAPSEAVEQTAWSGIAMPKITMPKLTMPQLTMPSFASVTSPVKSGFDKVSSGTRKAWEGTKEMLTFGQGRSPAAPAARVATAQKPTFWQRLIAKPPEPQGPQTVGEFMRQPRLDP